MDGSRRAGSKTPLQLTAFGKAQLDTASGSIRGQGSVNPPIIEWVAPISGWLMMPGKDAQQGSETAQVSGVKARKACRIEIRCKTSYITCSHLHFNQFVWDRLGQINIVCSSLYVTCEQICSFQHYCRGIYTLNDSLLFLSNFINWLILNY